MSKKPPRYALQVHRVDFSEFGPQDPFFRYDLKPVHGKDKEGWNFKGHTLLTRSFRITPSIPAPLTRALGEIKVPKQMPEGPHIR